MTKEEMQIRIYDLCRQADKNYQLAASPATFPNEITLNGKPARRTQSKNNSAKNGRQTMTPSIVTKAEKLQPTPRDWQRYAELLPKGKPSKAEVEEF